MLPYPLELPGLPSTRQSTRTERVSCYAREGAGNGIYRNTLRLVYKTANNDSLSYAALCCALPVGNMEHDHWCIGPDVIPFQSSIEARAVLMLILHRSLRILLCPTFSCLTRLGDNLHRVLALGCVDIDMLSQICAAEIPKGWVVGACGMPVIGDTFPRRIAYGSLATNVWNQSYLIARFTWNWG